MAEAGLPRFNGLSVLLSYYISIVKYYFEIADTGLGHYLPRYSNCNHYNRF
jgi:hypothetical protein